MFLPPRGVLLLASLLALISPAHGQGIDEADLLPVEQAFQPRAELDADGSLRVSFTIADGYYLYRERLKFNAEAPVVLGAPELPQGELKDDPNLGRTEIYHHAMQARLGVEANGASVLKLKLGYQGCAEIGVCYPPQKLDFELPLATANSLPTPSSGLALPGASTPAGGLLGGEPGGTATGTAPMVDDALPEDQAFRFEAIASDDHTALVRFTMAPGYYLYRDKTEFRLGKAPENSGLGLPVWPPAQSLIDDHFGEVAVYFDVLELPLEITRPAGGPLPLALTASFQGCKKDGICYPPMSRTVDFELPAAGSAHAAREQPPKSADQAAALSGGIGLLTALLFAMLGGLILNLMPCVLPILSLKALSLAESGRSSGHARGQALWYTSGVMLSFAAVGLAAVLLRNAGQAAGWGFQLQNPVAVSTLVLVMMVVGLSLSGVVSFGNSLMGVGQSLTEDNGGKGAFFTGVLAVVVASPCTAPFMFGALGFAFAQPPAISLLVFLALGLGMALPFLLIGFIPALAARLPRPGAWMEHFKQWLAFPMYLTAIWLLWVLGQQRGADAMALVLIGCVALAAAAWWWEKIKYGGRSVFGTIVVLLLVFGSLYTLRLVQQLPTRSSSAASAADVTKRGYEDYSEQRLAELLAAKTPVFINMTADWCATCKVNESTSLNTEVFKNALKDHGVVYLKGDWTDGNPAITAFLKRFNAVGVPLYVVFRKSDGAPTVLPTVLTPSLASEAVITAAKS